MSDPLDAALDLLRRLDPKKTSENLATLCSLVPDLEEDLLASVDQPLEIKTCKITGRDYLVCDYNRDGDSTRSPWSNEYEPPLSDGTQPSDRVRKMEVLANNAFDTYRDLYYEGGISSVYFWDIDDGFAGVVLLKKASSKGDGGWDSIHVFEAIEGKRGTCQYKLTSTVILHMQNKSQTLGEMNLGGNMTRQVELDLPVEDDASHIPNIGRMVEDMEFKMRNLLQEVYFGKTKDIVNDLRSVGSLAESRRERSLQSQVVKGLSGRV